MKRILVTTLLLAAAATGCTKNHASAAHAVTPVSLSAQPDLDATTTVATIDGHAVTAKDLDAEIGPQLGRLSQAFQSDKFELRKQALDELVIRRLVAAEAKKDGTTEAAWLDKHIGATPEVSEADAKTFYDQNSTRMNGRPFDQEKSRIVAFLTSRRRRDAAGKVFDGLKSKAKIEVLLEQPAVDVAAVGPSMGPETAPVTIVEFSDFQCPFCSKVEPTIKRVLADYAGKVRFVFRDYPLPFHEHAEKASEASHCAEEQGVYWPMHDALFANQDKLDVEGLKKLAAGVTGMDQAKFDRCLDSGEMRDQVATNEKAGEAVGVSGTPRNALHRTKTVELGCGDFAGDLVKVRPRRRKTFLARPRPLATTLDHPKERKLRAGIGRQVDSRRQHLEGARRGVDGHNDVFHSTNMITSPHPVDLRRHGLAALKRHSRPAWNPVLGIASAHLSS